MDWHDKASELLADHVGGAPEDVDVSHAFRDSVTLELDGEEWRVFTSLKAAEDAAKERLREDLQEEPGMFVQEWLANHLKMRAGDIRIFAQEAGDSYAEDMDDELAIEEADMEDALEGKVDSLQKAFDEAEAAYWDAEEDEQEAAEQKMDEAEERLDAGREGAIEELGDEARELVAENYAIRVGEQLQSDPLEYFSDRGMDVGDVLARGWVVVDVDAAADDAVRTDGVAHFLSTYDGNQIDLEDGFVAFRIN